MSLRSTIISSFQVFLNLLRRFINIDEKRLSMLIDLIQNGEERERSSENPNSILTLLELAKELEKKSKKIKMDLLNERQKYDRTMDNCKEDTDIQNNDILTSENFLNNKTNSNNNEKSKSIHTDQLYPDIMNENEDLSSSIKDFSPLLQSDDVFNWVSKKKSRKDSSSIIESPKKLCHVACAKYNMDREISYKNIQLTKTREFIEKYLCRVNKIDEELLKLHDFGRNKHLISDTAIVIINNYKSIIHSLLKKIQGNAFEDFGNIDEEVTQNTQTEFSLNYNSSNNTQYSLYQRAFKGIDYNYEYSKLSNSSLYKESDKNRDEIRYFQKDSSTEIENIKYNHIGTPAIFDNYGNEDSNDIKCSLGRLNNITEAEFEDFCSCESIPDEITTPSYTDFAHKQDPSDFIAMLHKKLVDVAKYPFNNDYYKYVDFTDPGVLNNIMDNREFSNSNVTQTETVSMQISQDSGDSFISQENTLEYNYNYPSSCYESNFEDSKKISGIQQIDTANLRNSKTDLGKIKSSPEMKEGENIDETCNNDEILCDCKVNEKDKNNPESSSISIHSKSSSNREVLENEDINHECMSKSYGDNNYYKHDHGTNKAKDKSATILPRKYKQYIKKELIGEGKKFDLHQFVGETDVKFIDISKAYKLMFKIIYSVIHNEQLTQKLTNKMKTNLKKAYIMVIPSPFKLERDSDDKKSFTFTPMSAEEIVKHFSIHKLSNRKNVHISERKSFQASTFVKEETNAESRQILQFSELQNNKSFRAVSLMYNLELKNKENESQKENRDLGTDSSKSSGQAQKKEFKITRTSDEKDKCKGQRENKRVKGALGEMKPLRIDALHIQHKDHVPNILKQSHAKESRKSWEEVYGPSSHRIIHTGPFAMHLSLTKYPYTARGPNKNPLIKGTLSHGQKTLERSAPVCKKRKHKSSTGTHNNDATLNTSRPRNPTSPYLETKHKYYFPYINSTYKQDRNLSKAATHGDGDMDIAATNHESQTKQNAPPKLVAGSVSNVEPKNRHADIVSTSSLDGNSHQSEEKNMKTTKK